MNKMKPVWRMNSGCGVPRDLGAKVCYSIGVITWSRAGHLLDESWSYDSVICISAYQTTRTREAKYKKVFCGQCLCGKNYHNGEGLHSSKWPKCNYCNGKGYTLEAIK